MLSGFDWDAGNWPKCGMHGVSQAEIEAIFVAGPMVLADRGFADESRFNALGVTADGRYLFVVFTYRGNSIRPISARYMHQKERDRYERQSGAEIIPGFSDG